MQVLGDPYVIKVKVTVFECLESNMLLCSTGRLYTHKRARLCVRMRFKTEHAELQIRIFGDLPAPGSKTFEPLEFASSTSSGEYYLKSLELYIINLRMLFVCFERTWVELQ